MKLRYLVPALGVLASTNFVAAETVGGLTIGGYVDVVSSFEHTGNPGGADIGNESTYGTGAAVELRIGYKVGDAVTAQVDLEWNNGSGSETISGLQDDNNDTVDDFDVPSLGRGIYLEQAYVNWAISDQFSLTAGKYTTYSGWIAADADGLYRINGAAVVPLAYGSEIVGLAGNFTASDSFAVSIFLVNGLSVVEGAEDNGNDTNNVAIGVDATLTLTDVGSVNFEAGYDYINDDSAEMSFAVNTTLNFASYEPLTLAGEIMYRSIGDFSADYGFGGAGAQLNTDTSYMLVQVLANHTIPASVPMSVTGQVLYAGQTTDVNGTESSPTAIELAVALLTNPTGDSNFGLNFEIYYGMTDLDSAAPNDETVTDIGVAMELLALIP